MLDEGKNVWKLRAGCKNSFYGDCCKMMKMSWKRHAVSFYCLKVFRGSVMTGWAIVVYHRNMFSK